jgi:hypothetical protein
MPDESSASETAGAGGPPGERFTWSPALVDENGSGDAVAVASGPAAGPSLELDLASQELAETTPDVAAPVAPVAPVDGLQPLAPSSDRAAELEGEHWRERAIVWRERAMAAELVAKMLQRNLDDLRSNLEDLRLKVEAAAAADAARTAAITSSQTPWRRFVRDMYDKYLG